MTAPWVARAALGLALAALAISGYLTIAHYTSSSILACVETGAVNCARVTTSAQSVIGGIPVAVLGLAWSIAMVVLCLPASWRSRNRNVHVARVIISALGVGFVLWLVYAELFVIRAICLWCTAMHVVAFALFAVVVLFATPNRVLADDARGGTPT